jgi:hypothetical protein
MLVRGIRNYNLSQKADYLVRSDTVYSVLCIRRSQRQLPLLYHESNPSREQLSSRVYMLLYIALTVRVALSTGYKFPELHETKVGFYKADGQRAGIRQPFLAQIQIRFNNNSNEGTLSTTDPLLVKRSLAGLSSLARLLRLCQYSAGGSAVSDEVTKLFHAFCCEANIVQVLGQSVFCIANIVQVLGQSIFCIATTSDHAWGMLYL